VPGVARIPALFGCMVMVNVPIAEQILMNAVEEKLVVIDDLNKSGGLIVPCFLETLKYFDCPLLRQPQYLYR